MKRINKILVGILICGILLSITMLAASNSKMIEAFYTGIKLYVDGAEYVPTDANGNIVEPFIYNGTTYLPVRAVANAFGKDVIWDGKNQTVYLGKKDQNQPDAYLHDLMYTDYREGNEDNWFCIIDKNVKDYSGKTYTSGLLFCFDWFGSRNSEIDYALNSQYKTLTGTIILPESYELTTESKNKLTHPQGKVTILDADTGEELLKVNGITATMSYKFEVDVRGVNKITIDIDTEADQDSGRGYVALTGLALYE